MSRQPPSLLAAIDRRLWRDLGFSDPEPLILPFLPSLVVAWSDGRLSTNEGEAIREHARDLPEGLRAWVEERLSHPPGPYFRYQVAHLLAFLKTVWPKPPPNEEGQDWVECGQEWADELIQEGGWFRRIFGGMSAEIANLAALKKAIGEAHILSSDRIWALARGTHAETEPARIVEVIEDHDQSLQLIGIMLSAEGEQIAVGTYTTLVQNDDLDPHKVTSAWAASPHLREPERWVLLGEEVNARGRAPSGPQKKELANALFQHSRVRFEECAFAELAYLEDALALDARWVSWNPGLCEELTIDREEVVRHQTPGTFSSPRAKVQATVAQQLIQGPPGIGFRVLHLQGESGSLRLATPAITQEPMTPEAAQWIARFLPELCDPHTQLVLDEATGSWVAEVHSHMPCKPAITPEPLPPGRALLIPPWIWFRAANALGVRFFASRRKVTATP